MPHHRAGLGRPDEDHAAVGQLRIEPANGVVLRIAVEIGQGIAAEDEVVARLAVHGLIEEVALGETHPPAHALVQLPAVGNLAEVPVPESERIATEGIASVKRVLGLVDGAAADVDGVDRKARRADTGIQQGHRGRIRLFTGRARHAEDAQHARRLAHQPFAGQPCQLGKGFAVAEEPGLGHHQRLDQRLALLGPGIQPQPVGIQRRSIGDGRAARRRFGQHGARALQHRALQRIGTSEGASIPVSSESQASKRGSTSVMRIRPATE